MEQRIVAALKAARRIEREVLARHGLTWQQYVALLELKRGPLPMGKWAVGLEQASSGLTHMADLLSRAGWIIRERIGGDRRVVQVRLLDVERLASIEDEVIRATARIMTETLGAVEATS